MNQYGYGSMVDDYTFLEDMGRKVEEWGREIVKERIVSKPASTGVGRPMRGGGMRGRGKGYGSRPAMDKKSYLSMQLSFRDVEMEVLPEGMERHKLNTSYWDSKCVTSCIQVVRWMLTFAYL
jgi:hypothetical protein